MSTPDEIKEWKADLIRQLDRFYDCWQDCDKRIAENSKCIALAKKDVDRALKIAEAALNIQKAIAIMASLAAIAYTILKVAKII
jgi:hypothetical protein